MTPTPVPHPAGPPWSWPDGCWNRPAVWTGSKLVQLRPSTPLQTQRSPTGRSLFFLLFLYQRCLICSVRSGPGLCSPTLSQDSTKAGICQRSWQQPMGVRLKWGRKRENDVEEKKCIRHPWLHFRNQKKKVKRHGISTRSWNLILGVCSNSGARQCWVAN